MDRPPRERPDARRRRGRSAGGRGTRTSTGAGSTFSREQWDDAMHVDRDEWFAEIASHNELFFKLYDRLPRDLTAVRDLLLAALCRVTEENSH